ncbi:MAG: agmatine deiminase family protein [Thermoanaerobaculia bacterium]
MRKSGTSIRRRFALVLTLAATASGALAFDGSERPLPAGPTPAEAALPLSGTPFVFAPPGGAIHTPAEYSRNKGLLLRWTSGFESELVAIAAAISNSEPPAVVTIVVSGASQQTAATNALSNGGANLGRIGFLVASSNSVWMRDYGPRFILEDKALAIVDHVYNRPARPADDQIPDAVGTAWSLPVYDLSLVHGGGNFHLFADGEAFMTTLVLAENPGLSEQDVVTLFAAYENLDVTIWPGFPTSYDSTRHIDMWLLPVRDRVAIVGEYPPTDTAPHQITEDAVTELTGRGYTVFRTPGWRASSTHYTYTNAVVFNHLVLVPQYNGYAAANAQALAVFAAAFPGKQLVPIDGSQLVTLAGVFHCIVMHVPDPDWIFEDDFETSDLSIWDGMAP